jgi:ribulose kinase
VKFGREVRKRCCLSPILFTLYSEYLIEEVLKGFGDFKIGGHVIRIVKYADGIVLLAKEETMLQGMIDRLIGIGSCCGLEMNVCETKRVRISRQPSAIQITIDKKLENVEYLNYLCSKRTNDAKCTRENKCWIAMVKGTVNKRSFHQQIGLKLRKKLVLLHLEHRFVWR